MIANPNLSVSFCHMLGQHYRQMSLQEANDTTRGSSSTLQLPEHNDPALNVIILTLYGIWLAIVLHVQRSIRTDFRR